VENLLIHPANRCCREEVATHSHNFILDVIIIVITMTIVADLLPVCFIEEMKITIAGSQVTLLQIR